MLLKFPKLIIAYLFRELTPCANLGYGEGLWGAQGAPRRAFGALCRHDGRMRLPPRFFARIPHNAHYDRHTDPCGVVLHSRVLITRHGGHGPQLI